MATILVAEDLCTMCGICSVVCPMSVIDPADWAGACSYPWWFRQAGSPSGQVHLNLPLQVPRRLPRTAV